MWVVTQVPSPVIFSAPQLSQARFVFSRFQNIYLNSLYFSLHVSSLFSNCTSAHFCLLLQNCFTYMLILFHHIQIQSYSLQKSVGFYLKKSCMMLSWETSSCYPYFTCWMVVFTFCLLEQGWEEPAAHDSCPWEVHAVTDPHSEWWVLVPVQYLSKSVGILEVAVFSSDPECQRTVLRGVQLSVKFWLGAVSTSLIPQCHNKWRFCFLTKSHVPPADSGPADLLWFLTWKQEFKAVAFYLMTERHNKLSKML